jgi:hypothetical protein
MKQVRKLRKPSIQKILDVSTAHVEQSDLDALEAAEAWFRLIYDEGALVWVPTDWRTYSGSARKAGVPERIVTLMGIANEHDCRFLRLDAEGAVYDELEIFDW